MKKYGYGMRLSHHEREAMREANTEPEKYIDRRALQELTKAAAADGALDFNEPHQIFIEKTKQEEEQEQVTTYRYTLNIE